MGSTVSRTLSNLTISWNKYGILVLALIITIFYILEYKYVLLSEDFVSNFLATMFGIVVGIEFAIVINEYQEKRTEAKRKEKILKVLKSNLDESKEVLKIWKQELIDGKDSAYLTCPPRPDPITVLRSG